MSRMSFRVSMVDHHGTGDLDITIASDAHLGKAKPFLVKSHEAS